jgi:hypothetical protein
MSNRLTQLAILTFAALLAGCGQQDRFAVVAKPEPLTEARAKELAELRRELEAAGVSITNFGDRPMAIVAGLSPVEAAWVEPAWRAAGIPGGPMIYKLGCFTFYAPIEDYYRAAELVAREREQLARIQLTDFDSQPEKR